jgi:hypothetical protein
LVVVDEIRADQGSERVSAASQRIRPESAAQESVAFE